MAKSLDNKQCNVLVNRNSNWFCSHSHFAWGFCSYVYCDDLLVFFLKEYALRDPSAAICCVARLTVIVFTMSTVIPVFVYVCKYFCVCLLCSAV